MIFNTDMHILPSLSMLNTFKVPQSEDDDLSVFTVEVMPGIDSEPRNLTFDWYATEMTERELKLQIMFDTAVYVSMNNEPETLRITFNDQYMFVSQDNIPMELSTETGRRLQKMKAYPSLTLERILPP